MAYTGINKAQNESNKYLIDEQAANNAFGTLLNTASTVGQAIYSDITTSQAQDLNRQLSEQFQKVDQEVYADTSIPPEERGKVLEQRYNSLIEAAKTDKKTLPGVIKLVSNNAKDRVFQTVQNWNAEDFQNAMKAKDAATISFLDSVITTNDVVSEYKNVGWIKDKDYQSAPKEEPMDFSEGFIGSKIGEAPAEEENPLFDQELHDLAYSGASEYDLRVAAIVKGAKQLHPHNKELQDLTIKEYTNKLRDALPSQDLELNFSKAFSETDPSKWGSYDEFYKAYAKQLEVTEYGGVPVTAEKKRELLEDLDKKWRGLNARVTAQAVEVYNTKIAPEIQALKTALANNSNALYTTKDVNKVFDAALKDHPGFDKFLVAEKEAQLTVARNNERLIDQRKFRQLYLLGGERTQEQEKTYVDLTNLFSDDELVVLKQQALAQAGNIEALKDFEKLGTSFMTNADSFEKARRTVGTTTFGSTQELDNSLKQYEGVLTEDQVDALRQSGLENITRNNVYKQENITSFNNDLTKGILDGSIKSKAQADEMLKSKGLYDDAGLRAAAYSTIDTNNQGKVIDGFYEQLRGGNLTDESLAKLIKDNEITDNKLIAGLEEIKKSDNAQEMNNRLYKMINDGDFTQEGLDTLIKDMNITDENVKYTLNMMLENSKLSNFQNKIGELETNQEFDINTLKVAIKENGIDESKNAAYLSKFYETARQVSVEKANKELGTKLYRGTLSEGSLSEVGNKYGLTVEDNPEFFNSWKNQTTLTKEDNARKMFNSLDFDDSITLEQVESIATKHGLGTDSDLYKAMKLKAEQNWQKHLNTIGATSQGFAEKSVEDALTSVGAKISEFAKGKTSRSDALEFLAEQRGNLSETDYKNAFNQIGNEFAMKKTTSDAIFEDKILRPFMQSSDTFMPGDTDKMMRDAGLDPNDYANDPDYLQMRDTEAINNNAKYVDQYTSNQMYLALRERGLSNQSIKDLGFDVPDMSFQQTIEWAKSNKGIKPETAEQYASRQVKIASSNMISGTLPSGKQIPGATSATSLNKAITESAERIREDLVNGAKVGARYDNIDAIQDIELAKFTMEDSDFDAFVYRKLMDGQLTEKSYLSYIAEDVSVFKGPEYKKFHDALETFSRYVKEESSYYLDTKGKQVKHDSIVIDSTVNGYKAAFLQEYRAELENSNGAPVNANDIAKRVYDRFQNTRYSEIANSVLDVAHMSNMNMYEGFFGNKEGVNYKAYQEYKKFISPSFDEERLADLLNDPYKAGAGFGKDSGGIGKWLSMYENKSDAKTVGNQIAYDVASHMGFNPPALDENFEKNFNNYLETLSPYTKSQLFSAVSVAKWATDITKFAQQEIPQDIINALDKNGAIVPVFGNRELGVQIGDTVLMFDEGGKRGNASFSFITPDNNLKSLETKNSVYANAQKSFSNGIINAFDDMHLEMDNVIEQDGDNITVNREFLVDKLNVELENRLSTLKRVGQNYVSVVNKRSTELEQTVGMTHGMYSGVEFYVDEEKLDAAIKDRSILKTPLSSFIGSKLIPIER